MPAISSVKSNSMLNTEGLSTASLLLIYKNQMGDLDKKIETLFEKQQKSSEAKKLLGKLESISAGLPEDGTGSLTPAQRNEIEGVMQDLIKNHPDVYNSLRTQLPTNGVPMNGNPLFQEPLPVGKAWIENGGPAPVNKEQLAVFKKALGNENSNLSANSEHDMIRLQDDLNKRQQLTSLMTNMLSTEHQTSKSILDNLR